MNMKELWNSFDQVAWDYAECQLYNGKIKPGNVELERNLERDGLRDKIAAMGPEEFLNWLRDQYFPWKFTGPELSAQRRSLSGHWADGSKGIAAIERVRGILVNPSGRTKAEMIKIVDEVNGLSVIGASGLLALTYPEVYGTVDVKVVKSFHALGMFKDVPLKLVPSKDKKGKPRITEKATISAPTAAQMMDVMDDKGKELNRAFGNINKWKPRSIDRVLWAVRGGEFDTTGAQAEIARDKKNG
jgi:hypothetical protein